MKKAYIGIISGICMIPLLTAFGKRTDAMKSADIFAMDTYMNIKAYGEDAEAAVAEAESRISELEQTFSVTNEASDIWAVNHADGQSVQISADTAAVLQTSQLMHKESKGAFSISLYPVLRAWGFTTGTYRIPSENEIASLLQKVDDTRITVNHQTLQCPADMEIDLGAVAQGYTGDAVMEVMREMGEDTSGIRLMTCAGGDECKKALSLLKAGKLDVDFVEGMICPGGCIGGPSKHQAEAFVLRARTELLGKADNNRKRLTC